MNTKTKGIIAGGSQATVDAGAEMFEQGGNAIDAAIASVAASWISENCLTTPGGGGFAVVHDARSGTDTVFDFFSTAPGLGRTSRPDPFDFKTVRIDFGSAIQEFYLGRGSVAVPGNMKGLAALHAELGLLPLKIVFEPAIRYARAGIPLQPIGGVIIELLQEALKSTPEMAGLYRNGDAWKKVGDHYSMPDLATTLEHLVSVGFDDAYRGDVAAAIVADQEANGGLMTAEDLRSYEVVRRKPLTIGYRGQTIITNPPPSSGGILIAFSLALLEGHNVATLGHGTAAHLELLAEVMRTTNLARVEAGEISVEQFLSPENRAVWADHLRQFLTMPYTERPIDLKQLRAPSSTTQVSAMDADGNAVSITTSAGESPGYIVPNTGLILNNMMGEEDLHPKGFHLMTPGTRLSSMMAPSIVLEKGIPRIVLGSGGSNRLRSAILQTMVNIIDFKMPVKQAVEVSRIHWERGKFDMEAGHDPQAIEQLRFKKIAVNAWDKKSMFFGGVHTVERAHDGSLAGAGDPRRFGAVSSN
ncbi:MAG: gamma-glutamyltransferase [bacterium]|nr:gamma-glutamyltransferase [bacterium]